VKEGLEYGNFEKWVEHFEEEEFIVKQRTTIQ
jgi:hypothetical protein